MLPLDWVITGDPPVCSRRDAGISQGARDDNSCRRDDPRRADHVPDRYRFQAAQAMDELNVGVIPVCDGEKLVGMVTDRDIVVRGVAQECDTKTLKLADVMSTNVRCATEDQDVDEVLGQMADTQIRRMPVVDGSSAWWASSRWGTSQTRTRRTRKTWRLSLGDISTPSEPDRSGQSQGQRRGRRRLGSRQAAAPVEPRLQRSPRYLTGVSVSRMIPPPCTLPCAEPAPRMRCTQASRSAAGWALHRSVAFWVKLFPPLLSSRPWRASSRRHRLPSGRWPGPAATGRSCSGRAPADSAAAPRNCPCFRGPGRRGQGQDKRQGAEALQAIHMAFLD